MKDGRKEVKKGGKKENGKRGKRREEGREWSMEGKEGRESNVIVRVR